MIRIQLNDTTRAELQALRRTTLPAKVRDRLEIVLLSDAGWSPPRIAQHLGCHPHTSRAVLKAFRDRGQPALWPDRPGPEPDQQRRRAVAGALLLVLAQERTWTSRQLSAALGERGIRLGPRQVRRHLKALKAGYRRTASTVAHKQDPAKVERAKVVLGGLKKKLVPAA
jgi:transposase